MPITSWSLHREDILLLRALQGIHHDDGFYIDVGANDPTYGSDTKLFYDCNWRGMNVEPSPHWFQKLVEQRPRDINIHAAASDAAGTITLYDHPEGGLGTTSETFADRHVHDWNIPKRGVEVPAYTLGWLCDRYIKQKAVHFLKIDVEGHEERVIRGMNFDSCRPWILCVEAVEPMKVHITTHQAWDHLLINAGYRFMLFDGLNRWYVAEEHPERFQAFANPTDDFLHWSARIAELEAQVRELSAKAE